MSRSDNALNRIRRAIGIARSLAIYHGIPGRQRRMRRLYAALVHDGDLVFDIGAHTGNHVRSFRALGCRVVAVEPQPDFARLLRRAFGGTSDVTILQTAVGETVGRTSLSISKRTPTVSTTSASWRQARASDPDFQSVRWDEQIDVDVTTLDALVERFGIPAFAKIDVEGSEPAVFAGLNHRVRALSFEYLPRALNHVEAVVTRLAALGTYEFNWSAGETYELATSTWLRSQDLLNALQTSRRSGDVYARLSTIALPDRLP